MDYIKGNFRTTIFQSDTGFFVGTFKIKETVNEDLQEKVNKTVTVTGIIISPIEDDTYCLYGSYERNERYGYQYVFQSYEKVLPEGKDAVIEFLSSNLIKGCGEKTAISIVEVLGEKAIDEIKSNKNNLFLVPNMTEARADKIYQSLLAYSLVDDTLIRLKQMGFSINEATKIVKKYQDKTNIYIDENLYYFKDLVSFEKIDKIYVSINDSYDEVRIRECFLRSMELLSEKNGDSYYYEEEIRDFLKKNFRLYVDDVLFLEIVKELEEKDLIRVRDEKYFLAKYDDMEENIANILMNINGKSPKIIKNFEAKINRLQDELEVIYNEEQKEAILNSLQKRVSIISGGPGTGKTTIINAITKLYIEINSLSPIELFSTIALLAPTGRASKKLMNSTNLRASTIHKFLKWNKETNDFQVNEFNKNHHRLIIIDECSMIDTYLLESLLKGLDSDIQIIFVGDMFQLPSVGFGNVLNDLISCGYFSFKELKTIYRQSENSYIPLLAKEIKEKSLSEDFLMKKDDFNFLECDRKCIKEMLKKIIDKSLDRRIKDDDIEILIPMYKGENGIDNINQVVQEILNPSDDEKKEIRYYDVIFRENDKVLQLVNNPDCNVYNGDIGRIIKIEAEKKNWDIIIDFDGNKVIYHKEDLSSIKHAYAMTIHKSQGSEFCHVIMVVCASYHKMLYNKLIYTGVSRAKKSLVIVGEVEAFLMAIQNDYSNQRKTDLQIKLENKFKDCVA